MMAHFVQSSIVKVCEFCTCGCRTFVILKIFEGHAMQHVKTVYISDMIHEYNDGPYKT